MILTEDVWLVLAVGAVMLKEPLQDVAPFQSYQTPDHEFGISGAIVTVRGRAVSADDDLTEVARWRSYCRNWISLGDAQAGEVEEYPQRKSLPDRQ